MNVRQVLPQALRLLPVLRVNPSLRMLTTTNVMGFWFDRGWAPRMV